MKSESTDDLNSELPVGENDVVESDEERSNVVCLSEMSIELFGEVLEDGLSDSSLCKDEESKKRRQRRKEGEETEEKSRCCSPGSAIPTVRSFSRTSLMTSME